MKTQFRPIFMSASLAIGVIVTAGAAFAATAKPKDTPSPKDDRVYASIKLPKKGFIHLDLVDMNKQRRNFFVTCEKEIEQELVEVMLQTGIGYHPLKKGGRQSLINYWKLPPTDYVIDCEAK